MSNIDQLDEKEIRQYPKLHGGIGDQVNNALKTYNMRMIDIKCNDFQANVNSSTKAAINALSNQMKNIAEVMEEVDIMIDCLLYAIQDGVLDEEDRIAKSVSEVQ